MIIPITVTSSSTNPKLPPGLAKISHDELVLVELQGVLEVESNHIGERDGKLVGTLKIDEATNKPSLRIGHHLLEGKIVALPKPLGVLLQSKSTMAPISGQSEVDQGSDVTMENTEISRVSSKKAVGWDMVAIVKRKIVFSNRPMPIVGRPT